MYIYNVYIYIIKKYVHNIIYIDTQNPVYLTQVQEKDGYALVQYTICMYTSLNACVTSMFVYSARRHLMVWAIFAPKYIFDSGNVKIHTYYVRG